MCLSRPCPTDARCRPTHLIYEGSRSEAWPPVKFELGQSAFGMRLHRTPLSIDSNIRGEASCRSTLAGMHWSYTNQEPTTERCPQPYQILTGTTMFVGRAGTETSFSAKTPTAYGMIWSTTIRGVVRCIRCPGVGRSMTIAGVPRRRLEVVGGDSYRYIIKWGCLRRVKAVSIHLVIGLSAEFAAPMIVMRSEAGLGPD